MKAIVFIAHGSKKEESNNEFLALVDNLCKKDKKYDLKKAAFLELAKPNIEDVVNSFIKADAKEVYFYPYFLNSGRHVLIDIPEIIKEFKQNYPHIKFKLLNHFGKSEKIEDIILNDINN